METVHLQERTENLKKDINRLLKNYRDETNLTPEAFQGILDVATNEYKIDFGIRL